MESLEDLKDNIRSCSKCGLCQSVCPIYKISGNDCTVSRGHFIMLRGLINGELKMSETINRYLDLCLKCGACSQFCPSGIDVVDIAALAKAEYFKLHPIEKVKSFFIKIGIKMITHLIPFSPKSKKFDKKVIYFAGCGRGVNIGENSGVIKILNLMNIEVITPKFECCGYPFFTRGDINTFKEYMDKFYKQLEQYENYDIVTNCATCEKVLKSYQKWGGKPVNVKNVIEYISDSGINLELKKKKKVAFHKPCNLTNFDDVISILNNTKNLEYVEMEDYDKCCGMAGLTNFKEYKIMSELYKQKRNSIIKSGVKTVLTSCLACKITLSLFSLGRYKVEDFIEFLSKNIK